MPDEPSSPEKGPKNRVNDSGGTRRFAQNYAANLGMFPPLVKGGSFALGACASWPADLARDWLKADLKKGGSSGRR